MQAKPASAPSDFKLPVLSFLSGTQGPLVGLILLCVIFAFTSEYFL
jgi:ribose transport system permease protein